MAASQPEAGNASDESADEILVDPARRLELLNDCRELVVSRLCRAIAETTRVVGDELHALAFKEMRGDVRHALLEAVSLVRQHGNEIQAHFRIVFADLFERRIHGEVGFVERTAPVSDELALLDDKVIQERMAADRLVQRARSRLDADEVLGVRARMGALLDRDWFDEKNHPASPEAVFEALRRALDQLDAAADVREALLQAFEPHIATNLNGVYAAVNEQLRSNHILPRIRHRIANARDAMRSAPDRRDARDSDAAAAERLQPLPRANGDPFGELLQQLADETPQARRMAARLFADPARFGAHDLSAPEVERPLLEALSSIQAGYGPAGAGGSQLMIQLLEQSRENGSLIDRFTVEIVSLVFDYIFADRRLPDTVKQQLLRLQVVAVKAALIERSFFAHREHPMRRLIDSITEAAIDPDADVRPAAGLVVGIAEIVDWVIASFETDLSIFDDAAMRLGMVVLIEKQRHAERLAELGCQARRLEALAIAQEEARAEIALRTDESTPRFVRDFLDRWWARSMAMSRLDGRAQEWTLGLRCAEALVWSVAPKAPGDVARLASLLPRLIGELMRGLRHCGIEKADREQFFEQLLHWHTEAIQQAKLRPAGRLLATPPGLAAHRTTEAASAEAASPPLSLATIRAIDVMQQGDTLEVLEDDGEPRRLRVAWLGPTRRLFMLTRFPDVERPMGRDELGHLLESGRARIAGAATTLDLAIEAIAVSQPATAD